MEPGRYMCVGESMNQWRGQGMPNLKKIPRKPHPIGQEYKTIADNVTDSWFGSPEMARKLMENGLQSIMQVAKRAYWPRGMPTTDIVQSLGPNYGDVKCMKSTVPGENMFVVAYRDLKAKALVSTCSTTTAGMKRKFKDKEGTMHEVIRPEVFDDYETNKSK